MKHAALAPLLAGALLAACATSAPKEPAASDVEAFMKRYTEVWNTHDNAAIARDFYRTGPSVEEQTAMLGRSFESLRAQGYHHSDIHEIKGCITGPDTAFAAMKYSRLKADGEPPPPKDRASSYDLTLFEDGWRIVKLNSYDAAKPLACPE